MRRRWTSVLVVFAALLVVGLVISLPPVWARVSDAADTLRIRARNLLFPQNEVVFQPVGTAQATITPPFESPTLTPLPSATPTPTRAVALPSPTLAPTPPRCRFTST